MTLEIRSLSETEGRSHLAALARVLVDCVEGGASVSFMSPFSQQEAEDFFRYVLEEVGEGRRTLLAAFLHSDLVGTVQIIPATPPNQPHRADVAKMLVIRSARGHGVGRRLMAEVEKHALASGRTLLNLDTVTGSVAERLYERCGWVRLGVVPRYALNPDGSFCDATFFWKALTVG